ACRLPRRPMRSVPEGFHCTECLTPVKRSAIPVPHAQEQSPAQGCRSVRRENLEGVSRTRPHWWPDRWQSPRKEAHGQTASRHCSERRAGPLEPREERQDAEETRVAPAQESSSDFVRISSNFFVGEMPLTGAGSAGLWGLAPVSNSGSPSRRAPT